MIEFDLLEEIILLGATGSIGTQVIEVAKEKNITIKAIAVGKNIDKAIEIIKNTVINGKTIDYISIKSIDDLEKIKKEFPDKKIVFGKNALKQIIEENTGSVVNAITGIAGLIPTIRALELKRNVYLANKESLVVAGDLIEKLAKENNVKVIPIDSEHNAIYRLIKDKRKSEISKLIITASGGAFLNKTRDELENVTVFDALEHPNWNMGKKITVDCASMVNKGLEVIEAHYLFGIDYEKIETIIHPESIIHSMVEFADNSVEAVMYNPSMIIPIQNALLNDLEKTNIPKIDFSKIKSLTFREMDYHRFPMIKKAIEVGKKGGLYPTVFNASNEVAVNLFLENKIKFLDIEKIIHKALDDFQNTSDKLDLANKQVELEDIIRVDEMVRMQILNEVKK